jgi:hypothetical protein
MESAENRFDAISVSTLIMMLETGKAIPVMNSSAFLNSVCALQGSGTTILAGLGADDHSLAPGQSAFGEEMHQELTLLVEAGL